jgi:hypothetical protein
LHQLDLIGSHGRLLHTRAWARLAVLGE